MDDPFLRKAALAAFIEAVDRGVSFVAALASEEGTTSARRHVHEYVSLGFVDQGGGLVVLRTLLRDFGDAKARLYGLEVPGREVTTDHDWARRELSALDEDPDILEHMTVRVDDLNLDSGAQPAITFEIVTRCWMPVRPWTAVGTRPHSPTGWRTSPGTSCGAEEEPCTRRRYGARLRLSCVRQQHGSMAETN